MTSVTLPMCTQARGSGRGCSAARPTKSRLQRTTAGISSASASSDPCMRLLISSPLLTKMANSRPPQDFRVAYHWSDSSSN